MIGNLAQSQQELLSGIVAPGLSRSNPATMKLETVMENIQRQRLRDQQRMKSPVSDDVNKGDDVGHDENGHGDADNRNGDVFSSQRQMLSPACSGSPKSGSLIGSHRGANSDDGALTPDGHRHDHMDDADSEENFAINSPRDNRELDSSFSRRRSNSNSPRSEKSLTVQGPGNAAAVAAAQQAAIAAAIAAANRGDSPTSNVAASMAQFFPNAMAAVAASSHSSLSGMQSAVASSIAQQFGQLPPGISFDPTQLPQGVRELALLQQRHAVAAQVAEAHKRLQEQQALAGHQNSSTSLPNPLFGSGATGQGSSASSTSSSPTNPQQPDRRGSQQEWTYEEQFKQLYEIDDLPERKQFLDELFTFMQKRGTPVNRIPIMAKQVLDLYHLYRLVVEKGGLVEVINKKIWREITKGLNLPSSITSAAFTLRTQYMKYLYPFECEREKLSTQLELQAAIEGNRREGRRPSYSAAHMFNYSPNSATGLTPPKIPYHSHNGLHQFPKYGVVPGQCDIPTSPTQHLLAQQQMMANAQHAAAMVAIEAIQAKHRAAHAAQQVAHHAAQQAAQHHPAIKHERSADSDDEREQHKKQRTTNDMVKRPDENHKERHHSNSKLQDYAADIRMTMSNQGPANSGSSMTMETVADSNSINMSIDVNGVTYQGVLYARGKARSPTGGHSNFENGQTPSPRST